MNLRRLSLYVAVALLVIASAGAAFADDVTTVITFSDLAGSGIHLGDAIPQGFGGTDLVTVTYSTPGALDPNNMAFWTSGYGDLYGVAFPNTNTEADTYPGVVTLTPAAGHYLTVNSFDIAGYGSDFVGTTPSDLYVAIIENGTVVWSYTGQVSMTGHTTFTPGVDGYSATSILFGPTGASPSWDYGITNISYTDPEIPISAPEPSSLVLLGTGLVSLAGAIRRRVK